MSTLVIGGIVLFSQTGLDANSTSTISNEVDIGSATLISFQVRNETGTSATHMVTMQCTLDGTNWEDTSETITGEGMKEVSPSGALKVRFKVTTAEGSASTINIFGTVKGG